MGCSGGYIFISNRNPLLLPRFWYDGNRYGSSAAGSVDNFTRGG